MPAEFKISSPSQGVDAENAERPVAAATISVVPNIGPLELVIVLVIALIIFGPKKLPQLGSSLGRGIREFRSSVTGAGGSSDEELAELEEPSEEDDEKAIDGEVVEENRA